MDAGVVGIIRQLHQQQRPMHCQRYQQDPRHGNRSGAQPVWTGRSDIRGTHEKTSARGNASNKDARKLYFSPAAVLILFMGQRFS
jgi:hypothetical protein